MDGSLSLSRDLSPVTDVAVYADPAPLAYLLPKGWRSQGNFIRHVMYVSVWQGCWFRWQLSNDGETWWDWLAT